MALSGVEKSTIGRSIRWGARALALRALYPVLPKQATSLAARWFATPDRHGGRNDNASGDPALPSFEDVQHIDVDVEGERIAAWSFGDGPAVLFAHGWNGHSAQFSELARAVAARGYRAVLFDQPAHGVSRGEIATLPKMTAAISAVARAVGGVHAVVAHSLGAAAAVLALDHGLQAERVVLIASPIDPTRWVQTFVGRIGLPADSIGGLMRAFELLAGARRDQLSPLRYQPRADQEILLVHDRRDREVPHAAALALTSAWPRAELLSTTGLGHTRILSNSGVVAGVAAFVAGEPFERVLAPVAETIGAPRPEWETRDAQLSAAVEAIAAAWG